MRSIAVLFALALLLLPTAGLAQHWDGFYDRQTLTYWQGQTPPGVEENFREVLWPKLTTDEKRALGRVTLEFPLEDASHPMNFYATAGDGRKTITLPVSSMRFLGDMALAWAWLTEHGYSTGPVTDYLEMLKYQWPEKLAGRKYRPREVLGIPDGSPARAFQRLFGTAIVFVLGHELGHLYHRHAAKVAPAVSRAQEEEADRFGMELMRRLGEPPVGMVVFFTILAHLEGGPATGVATHPVSSSRLRAIADGIEANIADFTRTGTSSAVLVKLAGDIRKIAEPFDDPGVQDLLRQKGLSARADQLGPRRAEAAAAAVPPRPAGTGTPAQLFAGKYRGKWFDAKGSDFDVEMTLTRQADQVRGSYNFGAGAVAVDGTVGDNALYYNWRWGRDYFGKGVLRPEDAGRILTGTWGYTRADSGAGTWRLDFAE